MFTRGFPSQWLSYYRAARLKLQTAIGTKRTRQGKETRTLFGRMDGVGHVWSNGPSSCPVGNSDHQEASYGGEHRTNFPDQTLFADVRTTPGELCVTYCREGGPDPSDTSCLAEAQPSPGGISVESHLPCGSTRHGANLILQFWNDQLRRGSRARGSVKLQCDCLANCIPKRVELAPVRQVAATAAQSIQGECSCAPSSR